MHEERKRCLIARRWAMGEGERSNTTATSLAPYCSGGKASSARVVSSFAALCSLGRHRDFQIPARVIKVTVSYLSAADAPRFVPAPGVFRLSSR